MGRQVNYFYPPTRIWTSQRDFLTPAFIFFDWNSPVAGHFFLKGHITFLAYLHCNRFRKCFPYPHSHILWLVATSPPPLCVWKISVATPPLLAYGHPNSISQPCPYDFLKNIPKAERRRNTGTEILVRVSPSLYILSLYYIYTGYFLGVHHGPGGGSDFFEGKGRISALVPLLTTLRIPGFGACSSGLQGNQAPDLGIHPVPKRKKRPPRWCRSRPALRGGVIRPGVPKATPGLYPATRLSTLWNGFQG